MLIFDEKSAEFIEKGNTNERTFRKMGQPFETDKNDNANLLFVISKYTKKKEITS